MDTIYAEATPPGRGGVSIVRVSGPLAHKMLADLTGVPHEARRLIRCSIRDAGEIIDDALTVRFDAGSSFTCEDSAEFHLHGSPAVVGRLSTALQSRGGRLAEPGEFTRRAFINGRIRRIHGRRVADLLHAMLDRRIERVEQSLEGLRLQYPGYAEEMERRFIRRTALRLEEREYDTLLEDGLIGEEVHSALSLDIGARRDSAEASPLLDLAMQKTELVRQFPLFSDMEEPILNQLSRALVTRYINPGEWILRRDSASRNVYFVASGAVEMEVGGQNWRLGRGEMFGQMGLLMRRPSRAEVRAIAPSTLLVLDEVRFLRLLKRSKAMQDAVYASAARRGIPTDQLAIEI